MNEEDQRIALLQHLGWSELNRDSNLGNFRALRGTSPSGAKNQIAPNPLKNLNIVRQIEFTIPDHFEWPHGWKKYLHILSDHTFSYDESQSNEDNNFDYYLGQIMASPQDRCMSLLKLFGLWKERTHEC